jgi:hypothetical protein
MSNNDLVDEGLFRALRERMLRIATIHAELLRMHNGNDTVLNTLIQQRRQPSPDTTAATTHQAYCGHWTDDELARTLEFKHDILEVMRLNVQQLERDFDLIRAEQRYRSQTQLPKLGDNDDDC